MAKLTLNNLVAIALIAFVVLSLGYVALNLLGGSTIDAGDSNSTVPGANQGLPDRVVVYYFYGTARCDSCVTIEAYTKEALETGFSEALKDGRIEWRPINVEKPENRHFIEDYNLYYRTVIVSSIKDGHETGWKRLDGVWDQLGDKAAFTGYVRDNVRASMEAL